VKDEARHRKDKKADKKADKKPDKQLCGNRCPQCGKGCVMPVVHISPKCACPSQHRYG
jgi:hypothetical protein